MVAACSHLPIETGGHADHDVVAEFIAPADGRVAMPMSDAALRVDAIALTPTPQGEGFGAAGRWFLFAPGARVRAQLRFRTFARADAPPMSARDTLPHAVAVRPAADAP